MILALSLNITKILRPLLSRDVRCRTSTCQLRMSKVSVFVCRCTVCERWCANCVVVSDSGQTWRDVVRCIKVSTELSMSSVTTSSIHSYVAHVTSLNDWFFSRLNFNA